MKLDWPLFLVVFLVMVWALLVISFFSPARAHAFYSTACCSDKDCGPAALGDVTWTPAGYRVLSTNETIPAKDPRIQYSPPGEPGYRLCIPEYDPRVRCLYVPAPES